MKIIDDTRSFEFCDHIRRSTGGWFYAALFWIRKNLSPQDVFNEIQLSFWAEENGYVKSEN